MPDIMHRIGATAAVEKVYDALTTRDGLAAWWTTDTTGDGVVGSTIQFRFGDLGGFDMRVLDRRPNERVEWEVIDGPAGVDRHPRQLRPEAGGQLHDRPVQPRRAGASGSSSWPTAPRNGPRTCSASSSWSRPAPAYHTHATS